MDAGFKIENLDKFEKMLLQTAKTHFPATINRILDSLGQVLLREAKRALKNTKRPHSRFEDWSEVGMGIQYSKTEDTNMIDNGMLWNSLTKGNPENVWQYMNASNTFRLRIGTNLDYAKWINDGYKVKKDHWVPGVVDGNGIFRYDPNAETGLMVKAREFEGVQYFDIAMNELEKVAPDIIRRELKRMVEKFYGK